MKVLKLSIIFLLMQLFLFVSLSAQEGENTNAGTNGILHGSSSDSISETSKDEEMVNNGKNSATAPDLTNKEKTESSKDAQKKSSAKNKSEAKVVQKTEDIKTEEIKDDIKFDGELLLINDGNFRYRRIPDIKLIDKVPEVTVNNTEAEMPVETDQKKENSYIDIWKILIIFIIVGIFILYMSRASGSAKMSSKSSRSRKVLNSYRK